MRAPARLDAAGLLARSTCAASRVSELFHPQEALSNLIERFPAGAGAGAT